MPGIQGLIATIFGFGTWINRAKQPWHHNLRTPLLKDEDSDELGEEDGALEDTIQPTESHPPNAATRILARFPFLLEIWYWLLTYWIYQGARALSAHFIANNEAIFDQAEHHALRLLSIENHIPLDLERRLQQYILKKTPALTPLLAQIYYSNATIVITYLVYSYTVFRRKDYQRLRRTLALTNIFAFIIFTFWHSKSPRFLPAEYGFIDVLHDDEGGSAWMQNKLQLTIAAMPSLHFGNAVLVSFGLVCFSPHLLARVFALFWPVTMGVTIFATASHFVLDAVVGVVVVAFAYWGNWVMLGLLPVERVVFGFCRLEKPVEVLDE